MNERFNQLSAQHDHLRTVIAIQRERLGETTNDIERQLSGVDRGVRLVRGIMRNPAVIVGAVALVAALGPRRLLGWVSRGAVLYTTAKRLRRAVR